MSKYSEQFHRDRAAQKPEPTAKPIVLPATAQGPTRVSKAVAPSEVGLGQQPHGRGKEQTIG